MEGLEEGLRNNRIVNNCDQPLKIKFHDLRYVIRKQKDGEIKTVLKNISGAFCPGKLTGIIGSSGSGKTSLLNIISGFQNSGVSGSITVNGQPRNLRTFKTQCRYIEQEFELLPLLTTSESLIIACDLKLGSSVNKYQRYEIVNEILSVLKLEDVSNNLVKYLSGGEKRRLAVGVELITNSSVMLFDEPTSGLDTYSSLQLMQHLKSLAELNKTIVCVIHQPSSRVFDLLDDVHVLTDGKLMYNGPKSDIISYFSKAGFNIPKFYNIADFVIELSKNHPDLEVKSSPQMELPFSGRDDRSDIYTQTEVNTTGIAYQCWTLLKRESMMARRNLYTTYAKLFIYLVTGIFIGGLWLNIGNEADKVMSNIPMIFCGQTASYLMCALVNSLNYGEEVRIITREYRNNWYSIHAYFISKFISQLPLQVIDTCFLVLPMYLLSGQILETQRLFTFYIIFILMNMVGESNGLLFGTLLTAEFAINILFGILLVMVILSGFVIRLDELPGYTTWLAEINFYKFSFEGCVQTIYGANRTKLSCPKLYCYFESPEKILEEMHMTDDRISWDITGLVLWVLILQLLFYCVLNWKQRTLH